MRAIGTVERSGGEGDAMSPGSRCDEILRLIDEVLGDAADADAPAGSVPAPGPADAAPGGADRRVAVTAR
jgi:hypothetical protein